ncbi:hypothetical protein GYMLUDRAFT_57453 [Collybiopsis luxurians FD-317 M1]|uniref:Zinc finger PHD-type domain-containing protein n=1 Tax=Collybiopsis luxurians FD-317 M1 TaxID=944289 RepID=A0A0D0C6L7_9AGAR|nr:hypothetical protein GYMLUDRAFT_57453 [Collybiopsis luxurians FD-317 M1]
MTSTIPAYLLPGVPVYQPSHLEGDSSLATEILPGPPSAMQNPLSKRDPRKDSAVYSYLPASDPGTTYSGAMHGTWIGQESRSSKRAKMDKGGASGRAQRASARNQNGSSNGVDLIVNPEGPSGSKAAPLLVGDTEIMIMDDESSSLPPPTSLQNIVDQSSHVTSTRGKKKDKGKGKEVENPVRIKEEPQTVSLRSPEPQFDNLGALVYCDGCPRAFHLWCLDPPMESVDEGDSRWFCPACTTKVSKSPHMHPPRKSPPGLLAPLIQALDNNIPTEYQLPDDIRSFFKDDSVGTSARGGYVNTSEIKPPRLNRHGQLEDRDAHRLRDRNGQPVLCFRCGTSALPESTVAAAPATKRARRATAKAEQYEMWKNIISCDYCDLHWHLDCLDPPLSTMPSFSKKWMCPNHAEQMIASLTPKHRIPKQNATPIEISKPGQYNNGNIEIIETQSVRPINVQPKVAVDEVLINGRRYRVPERIILLDFWNKISKNVGNGVQHADSLPSSPLTSLSSLDEEEFLQPLPRPTASSSHTDVEVAKASILYPRMLWDFKRGFNLRGSPKPVNGSNFGNHNEYRMVADPLPPPSQPTPKPARTSKASPTKKGSIKAAASTSAVDAATASMVPPIETLSITPSTSRRRKADATEPRIQLEPSARTLRSRSKVADRSRSGGDDLESSASAPPPAASSSKTNRVRVKVEESDTTSLLFDGGTFDFVGSPSVPAPSAKPSPKKRVGKKKAVADGDANGFNVKQENDPPAPAPKRGRKRKERDDEAPYIDRSKHKTKEKREVKPRASKSVPSTTSVSSLSTILSSTSGASTSTPTTPSLKIRLPPSRMNALGSPIKSVATTSSARSS